ncbi:RAI1 like PD-(D/E)XK nuclease [Teratosphaeria destructans]|uniref:Decapping nuclease n=1 Tax=Teratosphaeria destructans TaxID=418781 RepID=A0A9W7SIU1_9PEZI|nr:RAI1 like PD-(D/E)XK nuclease [Teratosphaeria destructans]
MPAFEFHNLDRFAGSSASIKRPREFAYFSFDEEHRLHPLSDRSLSYYYPPFFSDPGTQNARPDLSAGFDTFRQRDDTLDEHLDALLDTLQAHEERVLSQIENGESQGKIEDVATQADIITWRGMMTKILTAPFDGFSDFEMNATCYQVRKLRLLYCELLVNWRLTCGSFIEENHQYKVDLDRKVTAQPSRQHEASQAMMQYWGYKFETLSVIPKPWAECSREEIEARDAQVVNNHVQYCSIVRTGIGTSSLVIAGEVDAVLGGKPDNPDDPIPWVELKTTAEPPNAQPFEILKFERKLLRFWAQSFLLGVPMIAIGYRTHDGRLVRIQELQTQRIPSLVKQGMCAWNGNVCINFTAGLLDMVKATVGGREGVWRLQKRRNEKQIRIFQIQETGTGEILKNSFKAHREKLRKMQAPS